MKIYLKAAFASVAKSAYEISIIRLIIELNRLSDTGLRNFRLETLYCHEVLVFHLSMYDVN